MKKWIRKEKRDFKKLAKENRIPADIRKRVEKRYNEKIEQEAK